MNVRHLSAIGLVTCGLVAFVPVSGWAQEGEGEEGGHEATAHENTTTQGIPGNLVGMNGYITLVGCFTRGTIGKKDTFVLLNPTIGPATTVPDAACSATGNDSMIKLERVNKRHMADRVGLGQWVEVSGKLEKNDTFKDGDRRRELEVTSFRPVPVAQPRVVEVIPTPMPVPTPAPPAAPPVVSVEPAPVPETPAPVGTTGEVHKKHHRLPRTASSLPLAELMGFICFGTGLALLARRRRLAGRG